MTTDETKAPLPIADELYEALKMLHMYVTDDFVHTPGRATSLKRIALAKAYYALRRSEMIQAETR